MKQHNNRLMTAIRYALIAGVATGVSNVAFAQTDEESTDSAELDRVMVTGSRISRADVEDSLPVFVIDREDIELSGQASVADLLRDLPMTTGGNFRPQSGSSAQSFAGANLRALGEGRTLILIDGRRAPIAPNFGSAQDLRSIPLGAVERIEILADGASAIYGSDAIGGVINIITRADYTGAEVSYTAGFPSQEGGDFTNGHAIMGISGDRGQIMAGVSYDDRDIIFQNQRPWNEGGASSFSNNFMTATGGFLAHPTYGSANTAGCQDTGFTYAANGASGRCLYDFQLVAADEAASKNESGFIRGKYDISNDWTLLLNASVGRVTSFGRYAPVPSSPWLVGNIGNIELPVGSPNHPATPPDQGGLNPLWADYQDYADTLLGLRHRFAANGPRDTSTDAQLYDVDLGVIGTIFDSWTVEARVRQTESQYYENGRNYIVSALAQPQFTAGNYNIYDPSGNPLDVLQSFTATITRDSQYKANEYFAVANGDLFVLPAGPVSIAFGGEYREEQYKDIYDDLQANGNITGSAGNSASGSRDYSALFAELLVPVIDSLELNFAARFDDYSDFGSEVSPKASFRWQPLDSLTVRGSWGQGFRAPPLDILSANTSFSADTVFDPPTCVFLGVGDDCVPNIQVTTFVIANPNLGAETSNQYGLGLAFEPFDWLNGTIDYYNIEIEDRVAAISSQTIINCLNGTTTNCPPGITNLPNVFPGPNEAAGLGLLRGAAGEIQYVQRGFASLGTIETSGIDMSLNANFDLGVGMLTSELLTTYLLSYEVDSGAEQAGTDALPEWRANWRNVFAIGDFSFAAIVNYIDEQTPGAAVDKVDSWTTFDLQANWFTPWDGQITVGVDNVGDEDPPLDNGYGDGYNFDLYDAFGRVVYGRYTQTF